jgi:hypothetical protein
MSTYDFIKQNYKYLFDVPWPSGEIVVENKRYHTDDPNDLVRPVLESEVGAQGTDWDWCVCPHTQLHISIGVNKLDDAVSLRLVFTK